MSKLISLRLPETIVAYGLLSLFFNVTMFIQWIDTPPTDPVSSRLLIHFIGSLIITLILPKWQKSTVSFGRSFIGMLTGVPSCLGFVWMGLLTWASLSVYLVFLVTMQWGLLQWAYSLKKSTQRPLFFAFMLFIFLWGPLHFLHNGPSFLHGIAPLTMAEHYTHITLGMVSIRTVMYSIGVIVAASMAQSRRWRPLKGIVLVGLIMGILSKESAHIQWDMTSTKTFSPPVKMVQQLAAYTPPIHITFFLSSTQFNDPTLFGLSHWLTELSPRIHVQQMDPITSPQQADRYDIEHRGTIVLTTDTRRMDISLIDLAMRYKNISITDIQNHLLQAIRHLINIPPKSVLFIHSSPEPLLADTRPLGLSQLAKILARHAIHVDETTPKDAPPLISKYDSVVLYKIGPSSTPFLDKLTAALPQAPSRIIFGHPRHAKITNLLTHNVQFHTPIIEDPRHHLHPADNQLIVPYISPLNALLTAVVPFSSYLTSKTTTIWPMATTHTSSVALTPTEPSNGPFTIMARTESSTDIWINNHLLPTNHWIQYGDNQAIITDIFLASLHELVRVAHPARHPFIMTQRTVFQWVLWVLIVPTLSVFGIGIGHAIWQKSR
ncbi:MAG: hypothetical protein ACO3K7_06465 [Candidatus Marinamargulisbacteria bacterium]